MRPGRRVRVLPDREDAGLVFDRGAGEEVFVFFWFADLYFPEFIQEVEAEGAIGDIEAVVGREAGALNGGLLGQVFAECVDGDQAQAAFAAKDGLAEGEGIGKEGGGRPLPVHAGAVTGECFGDEAVAKAVTRAVAAGTVAAGTVAEGIVRIDIPPVLEAFDPGGYGIDIIRDPIV